ncbi:acetyl/propionyl/methylcrotonyl-CoA carboxylase subunit alpha [Sphingomicrobium astaxanthinifaciens]|uniref:acetyl/propionyl/methylcrotonyl-CoA carboxylase subunit alpha n=1 Tax=Sphingomicrobium astaxanthinifaciens TaxID=1227949 RepID=UPI001FCA8B6C|nr:acetyl/propionyl/methylcrotonyl-CoA carboxylase subunit alpha [Sphingomicrobium astaxanthinifaciens]MCJ7421913.1 acetyl/propionyl/methylcrotonyl-CoA carboxylase subunit alpha [Sphingomicrobium astaxanthinifaciens]
MFDKLLIANRGEIACRVMRTAQAMGIHCVAVHSEADARALHVRMADEAVCIGPAASAESYLVGERIIEAAKETGAEAIHPGYGFLSENADFAEAVIAAGLVWVGPKPESIRAMGLKDAAKKLMADAEVPVTPGYMGEDQSAEALEAEAGKIGYPVLIKAVAGGGGKGMRKVDDAKDFADALASVKREAKASFGNDVVILEKWIESPRHIEVQLFGDSHGNVLHLFERDCSLQRRHQKVIEEAPAPGMDAATREAVCAAAVRAGQAVDYEGAGTVEFIADASEGLRADRIWFMEMNTRLQVEHPVTEEITGVDLVEWQLLVAAGEPVPVAQDELSINGHAIEARLYAEDPASGFLPSTGRLEHFDLGREQWRGRRRRRIETGVEEGDMISPHYDPMIAKLVSHAPDREGAIETLARQLAGLEIWPVRTNAAFLLRALTHEEFVAAKLDTGFIARHDAALIPSGEPVEVEWRTAAAIALAEEEPNPLAGFRLNADPRLAVALGFKGETRTIDLADEGDTVAASGFRDEERVVLFSSGEAFEFSLTTRPGAGGAAASDGALLSPMPGKVTSVAVEQGQAVAKGERLLTLEAMKMEHAMTAPFDGVVAELNVAPGQQVAVEALLARVDAAD